MNVKVYTSPGCQPCRLTKVWLDNHGVAYDAMDVSQDASAEAAARATGLREMPIVTSDRGAPFGGFRPDLLKEFLA